MVTPASPPIPAIPSATPRPTWLEIDLAALAANVAALRRRIGPDRILYAVVKANAYGHGADLIAPAALHAGADRLAVAALNEAVELRLAGVTAPILVLGYTPPDQAGTLLKHRLTATVYEEATALAYARAAERYGRRLSLHLKVDTGMHRLGVDYSRAFDLCARLAVAPHLRLEGIFTHFSTADQADQEYSRMQLERFGRLLDRLERAGCRPATAHAANSAATLSLPQAHLDAVRCGILLYGLSPGVAVTAAPQLRPVLSWKARVVQVRRLAAGEPVSYGNSWRASRPSVVAVVPVGYADGFPRSPRTWGSVLIHGRAAPVAGRVCMDQTVVDVTAITHAGIDVVQGDEVVLIGSQGDAAISVDQAAARLETINYEVTSRLMARLPRTVTGAGDPSPAHAQSRSGRPTG